MVLKVLGACGLFFVGFTWLLRGFSRFFFAGFT